jgi:hypothetical protein
MAVHHKVLPGISSGGIVNNVHDALWHDVRVKPGMKTDDLDFVDRRSVRDMMNHSSCSDTILGGCSDT